MGEFAASATAAGQPWDAWKMVLRNYHYFNSCTKAEAYDQLFLNQLLKI